MKSPVPPRLLVAGVAATLSLGLALPAAAATPASSSSSSAPATTSNVATGAAGWLEQQLVGGTHVVGQFGTTKYVDYGNTIGVIFALAATGGGRSSINAATSYVAHHLDEYADLSGSQGGPYDGSIAKAAVAALVAGRNPNRFGGHHLLSELKSHECASGSTDCTPGNNEGVFSTVSTSLIVLAEARGAKVIDDRFAPSDDLVNFFTDQQCDDGGFTSAIRSGTDCTSDIDATGYAIMALHALGGHATAIKRAASWLVSQRRPDGAWTSQGGQNTDSTALAVAGLHIAGRATAKSVAWLRKQQVTSGPTVGKNASRGALKYLGSYEPSTSVFATNDGVLGITRSDLGTLSAKGATKDAPVLALHKPSIAKHTVRRGHKDSVTGTGFAPTEHVVVQVGKAKVGKAKTDADGTVTLHFTVPQSLSHHRHKVVLTGRRSGLTSRGSLTVR